MVWILTAPTKALKRVKRCQAKGSAIPVKTRCAYESTFATMITVSTFALGQEYKRRLAILQYATWCDDWMFCLILPKSSEWPKDEGKVWRNCPTCPQILCALPSPHTSILLCNCCILRGCRAARSVQSCPVPQQSPSNSQWKIKQSHPGKFLAGKM